MKCEEPKKKPGRARPYGFSLSGVSEACGVGERRLGILYVVERLSNDLLGDASAFSALTGHAGRFTDFTVAAAAFIDGLAELTVGDALAKTDVHKHYPLSSLMFWMLI